MSARITRVNQSGLLLRGFKFMEAKCERKLGTWNSGIPKRSPHGIGSVVVEVVEQI